MNNLKLFFNLAVLFYLLLVLVKNNIIIDFNLIFVKLRMSLWLIIFFSFTAGIFVMLFNNIKSRKKKKNKKNEDKITSASENETKK